METDASSASKDLQEISSTIAVNDRIDAGAADQLIKNVGTAYESTIISPAIAECVKAVTSQYTAEELITTVSYTHLQNSRATSRYSSSAVSSD